MQRVKSISCKSFLIPAVFAAALAITLPSATAFACDQEGCTADRMGTDGKKEECKCKSCKDGKCKHDHKHAHKHDAKKDEKTEAAH